MNSVIQKPTFTDKQGQYLAFIHAYALRFGERDIWKVGHTQNLATRLAEINQHVPHEELGECWSVVLHCRWNCSMEAYQMEQGVLGSLGSYRTEGERARCSEEALKATWCEFVRGGRLGTYEPPWAQVGYPITA
jgi:hypothetical protein